MLELLFDSAVPAAAAVAERIGAGFNDVEADRKSKGYRGNGEKATGKSQARKFTSILIQVDLNHGSE